MVDFRQAMGQTPRFALEKLLTADSYPSNPLQVQAFYAEAAIIVDFLTKSEDRRGVAAEICGRHDC